MLRQLILEKYDNLSMKQKKRIINLAIDIAVAMYQESHSEEDFALICDLLPPNSHFLKNKYAFLCDEYADFDAEYLFCFVKACNEYGKNKKKMTSNFQSYFFPLPTIISLIKLCKLLAQKGILNYNAPFAASL